MSEPFLGEIRIMSFNWAPQGWAMCNGQFLPINQNQALFSLLGTNFGGDGRTTFQLPDFRARVPMHTSNNFFTVGQRGGENFHTVSIAELPTHTHVLNATSDTATQPIPANTLLLGTSSADAFGAAASLVAMAPTSVTNVGGSQPHENRQPYIAATFCIALQGVFPTQN